jgi:hypothetical protein
VNGTRFTSNDGLGRGGGLCAGTLTHGLGDALIVNASFTDNTASHGGGLDARALVGGESLVVSGSTFMGNDALTAGGLLWRARAPGASAILDASTVAQNTAAVEGGGMLIGDVDFAGNVTVQETAFRDNTAPVSGGVGIHLSDPGDLVVFDQTSATLNTSATCGAGMRVYGGPGMLDVVNSTVSSNHGGAGVCLLDGSGGASTTFPIAFRYSTLVAGGPDPAVRSFLPSGAATADGIAVEGACGTPFFGSSVFTKAATVVFDGPFPNQCFVPTPFPFAVVGPLNLSGLTTASNGTDHHGWCITSAVNNVMTTPAPALDQLGTSRSFPADAGAVDLDLPPPCL